MTTPEDLERALFVDRNTAVYAVLDGASIPDLLPQLHSLDAEHQCLFAGKLHPEVAQTAPYLVSLPKEHPFTSWLIEKGWGKHWGIFVTAPAELKFRDVRKHMRTFLRVRSPEGSPMLFRYYDPRVLRLFMPACDEAEREQLFGPLIAYIAEGEAGEVLQFKNLEPVPVPGGAAT